MNSTSSNDSHRPHRCRLRPEWVFLLLLPFLPMTALGDQEGDFEFQTDGEGTVITRYLGPGGAVMIPDHLGGNPVKGIGVSAFIEVTNLTSVTIPNGVISIGVASFAYCTSLTNIIIPDSVNRIDGGTFYCCTRLTSVNIPDSVIDIGGYAFYGCTSLTNVIIGNSVNAIRSWAFSRCASLMNVDIPDSVTSIEDFAFYGCTGLTSATVGNGVTLISSYAFSGCTGLTSITIPDSVNDIAYNAFQGCTGLTAIHVGALNSSFSSIEGVLLDKTQSALIAYPGGRVGAYIIPNSVTDIGQQAFSGCMGLRNVAISNNVTNIGSAAFSGCTGLSSVTIGNGVTVIGVSTFAGCISLTSVTIPDSVSTIVSGRRGWGVEEWIYIPGAFEGCVGLTNITFGNSVTLLGSYAFLGCAGLTSATIPNSVTTIGYGVFEGCTSLLTIEVDALNPEYSSLSGVLLNKDQSILIQYPTAKAGPYIIPDSVTQLRNDAFYGRSRLTSVTFGCGMAGNGNIGVGWFLNCTSLMAIEVGAANPNLSTFGGVVFNKDQTEIILCPPGKVGLYIVPDSVSSVNHSAFYDCTGLTSVTIPNSVTSIGSSAFSGCTSLENVTIGNSVTSIGDWTFARCGRLTSVTLGAAITFIDSYSFFVCTNLVSMYFEGNAPAAPSDTFLGSPLVTAFYRLGTDGWSSSFAGRPTAVWEPRSEYADWAVSTGLTAQFPGASAEGDDPDGDGFSNHDEWFAGTDPTQRASRLEMEFTPRPADLNASDQTPVEAGQHAVYFRSVPSRYYGVQRTTVLGGAWELQAVRVADTAQTRFVLPQPDARAFYRVLALP